MKSYKICFRRVFVIIVVVVGLVLLASTLFCHEQAKYPEKLVDFYKRKIIQLDRSTLWLNKDFAVLKKIEKFILEKKPQGKTELIDMSRWFVRNGFIVKHNKWYDENKYDTELVLETIHNNHVNPSSEPAYLDCQPSARAFACILNFFGFQTRLVAFLGDDYDDLIANHAMVEVLNPDSGRWELQDPLYDIFFYDAHTGQRVSAIDIVFGDTDNIIPSNGKLSGWDKIMHSRHAAPKPQILKDHYFEVLAYKHVTRKCFVFINVNKVSLTKRFPENDNLTILEFIKKVYGNPPVFMFPPGEYEAY